jgi:peptidoglycan/xylan/chitin deacetylase (PgdA/CDA1 family)
MSATRLPTNEPMATSAAHPRRSRSETVAAWHDAPVVRRLAGTVPAWRGVLVLNYHRIGSAAGQPWDRGLWSATTEGLDEHLALLSRHADVIGPGDLAGVMARGRGRHVLLTFDDGYRDNYDHALPLLRRHGLTATFFLTSGYLDAPRVAWWDEIAWMVRHATGIVVPAHGALVLDIPLSGAGGGADDDVAIAALIAHYKQLPGDAAEAFLDHVADATGAGRCDPEVGGRQWMTWDMARELLAAGMDVGGHTVTHPILARLGAAEQQEEIARCADRLRAELGIPMRWFSYPVGGRDAFDDHTRAALRAAGTEIAFSFYGGYQRFGAFDALDVPRIHVGPQMTRQMLQVTLRFPQLFARAS